MLQFTEENNSERLPPWMTADDILL
jgi:hypothetical protein